MDKEKKEESKKAKRPTAQKRDMRNEKMRLINKAFKSNVRTTMRSFEEALQENNKEKIQSALNTVYSMMDLGVKRGIYKPNKAARIKSRTTQRLPA